MSIKNFLMKYIFDDEVDFEKIKKELIMSDIRDFTEIMNSDISEFEDKLYFVIKNISKKSSQFGKLFETIESKTNSLKNHEFDEIISIVSEILDTDKEEILKSYEFIRDELDCWIERISEVKKEYVSKIEDQKKLIDFVKNRILDLKSEVIELEKQEKIMTENISEILTDVSAKFIKLKEIKESKSQEINSKILSVVS